MTKTRRSFTDEFKREAAKLVKQPEAKVTHIARGPGIEQSVLRRWVSQGHGRLLDRRPGRVLRSESAPEVERQILANVDGSYAEQVFGAATVLLREPASPARTLRLHSLLAPVTVCSDEGLLLQHTFSRAVARRFSPAWEELLRNAFLFKSPRVSVPMLRQVVADVEDGRLRTKRLLSAAAVALGFNPEKVDSRIA